MATLKERAPDTGFLLSQCRDEPFVAAMLRAGADGYLLKTCAPTDLIRGVRLLGEGRQVAPVIDRTCRSWFTANEMPMSC